MTPVYIASHTRFEGVEPVTRLCINTNSPGFVVRVVRPEDLGIPDTGCTGFSNIRYCIPELLRRSGDDYGIYLDVDMLVLANLSELMQYAEPGKYVCLQDGSTEVGVVSSELRMPSIKAIGGMKKHELDAMLPKSKTIPAEWNSEDRLVDGAKILHFTDLKTQPWFFDHPDQAAREIWESYADVAQSV